MHFGQFFAVFKQLKPSKTSLLFKGVKLDNTLTCFKLENVLVTNKFGRNNDDRDQFNPPPLLFWKSAWYRPFITCRVSPNCKGQGYITAIFAMFYQVFPTFQHQIQFIIRQLSRQCRLFHIHIPRGLNIQFICNIKTQNTNFSSKLKKIEVLQNNFILYNNERSFNINKDI